MLQLTLNMLVLGPIVLTTVFTWNLTLTGKAKELPSKLRRDLVPAAIDGASCGLPKSHAVVLYLTMCLQASSSGSLPLLSTSTRSLCSIRSST